MSRACVFLDRDGVINEVSPIGEYITRWSDFYLIPATVDWIRLFNALGLLVFVITNQRGVALGRMTMEELDFLHTRMRQELALRGAIIDDIFTCPHHEGECDCRKPKTGLVLMAQQKWDIDLTKSIVIGDSYRDRDLAANLRIPFVHVLQGQILTVLPSTMPRSSTTKPPSHKTE